MNRRLFPLALSLALLAGCAPAPEPTPEPTPTPAAAVDFHTFLDAVTEKRRAVIEDGEPLDVSAWTPAFADQNTTFTDGEMELLLTPHGPEENLTMEQAREDVETAFTLLRTTYGAYEYFGGDQVFDGLREDALARLGLTRREANEFIVFWLPQLEENPYNLIAFQTDAYTDHARLTVTPEPDTVLRVFMAWKPLDAPVEIEAQPLTAPTREGFTLVEWGGSRVD